MLSHRSVAPSAAARRPRASSASTGRRWIVAAGRCAAGLCLAAAVLLLSAFLALHWIILPHIEQWRSPLAAKASAALGARVRIGNLRVASAAWLPPLELRDVVVSDARGMPALRLPLVRAELSARGLFAGRFERLTIDGADLDIRRDPDGRLHVAGLTLDQAPTAAGDSKVADWFFAQPLWVLEHGTVRWSDAQRGAPPLALTAVRIVVDNGLQHHRFALDATPPPALGRPFALRGRFVQPLLAAAGDWRRWTGTVYVDLPQAEVMPLLRYVDLPFDLADGGGAARAWIDVDAGAWRGLTADVALPALTLRAGTAAQGLGLTQISGRLSGRRTGSVLKLSAERFGFTVPGVGIWPRGDITATLQSAQAAPPARGATPPTQSGEVQIERLDLGLLAHLVQRLQPESAAAARLASFAPQGAASDVRFAWRGPPDALQSYRLRAEVSGLAMAASAAAPHELGRPGLRRADVVLDANERGGSADLSIVQGAVVLPGVFEDPDLALARLQATLRWTIGPPRADAAPAIRVQVQRAHVATADVAGDISAEWTSGTDPVHPGPGRIDLEAHMGRMAAVRLARYLPLGMPADSRLYVERALRSGDLVQTDFRVKGELRGFPFYRLQAPANGIFHMATRLEDAAFAFAPSLPDRAGGATVDSAWPAFARVGGDIVIDRATLQIHHASAHWGSYQMSGVEGSVADLGEHPTLQLDGSGAGPLPDLLGFVAASPLGAAMGHALDRTTANGDAALQLGLTMPLTAVASSTVVGALSLDGVDIRMAPGTPLLGNARGRVDFTQRGFAVSAAARVLGGEAHFEGGNLHDAVGGNLHDAVGGIQHNAGLHFNGSGTATAEGLRQAPELGWLSRLATSVSGQANYRIGLGFSQGQSEIEVATDLVGMASQLPAPLDKPADATLPLHYQTVLDPAVAERPARDTLRFALGPRVQAVYRREFPLAAAANGHDEESPRVLNGAIGVETPAPASPASGVSASANLTDDLDVDAWQTVIDRLAADTAAPSASAATVPPSASSSGDALLGGYGPATLDLRAPALRVAGRRVGNVTAALTQHAGLWRADVEADQLGGHIAYRVPQRAGDGGRLYARLKHLSVPPSDDDPVERLLGSTSATDAAATRTLPALDIAVDDFELRGKRLGRVAVEAANRARVWTLQRLSLTTPEARLEATGTWSPVDARPLAAMRTALDFKLTLTDAGALLQRLIDGRALAGGKGALDGHVGWLGSPLALDYPSLGGQLHLALDDGRFLQVEPGAARLLGVLSLQALPRRLLLDFRDIFESGFAFDNVVGDVHIASGVASTNNLRMRGVQAAVLMEGAADIERETQQLHVVVVPEISAGTATLAYAVINPAVGLGTFLAQLFLRKPLAQANTREFNISGAWDDPKVERIDRARPGAAPASAAPTARADDKPPTTESAR